MENFKIELTRLNKSTTWGFSIQGGKDFGCPLSVLRVTPNSISDKMGLRVNDLLIKINDISSETLTHQQAILQIQNLNVLLELKRLPRFESELPPPPPVIDSGNFSNSCRVSASINELPPPPPELNSSNVASNSIFYPPPPPTAFVPQTKPIVLPSKTFESAKTDQKYSNNTSTKADKTPELSLKTDNIELLKKLTSSDKKNQENVPSKSLGKFLQNQEEMRDSKDLIIQKTNSDSKMAICFVCKDRIKGSYIEANNKIYCSNHFCCSFCSKPIKGTQFIETKEGTLYCMEDFENHVAPRCFKCSKSIIEQQIMALGKCWHPQCFLCNHCHKSIPQGQFHKSIQINFNTKLYDVNFNEKIAKFKNLKNMEDIEKKFDLLVGNDGAYSHVRHIMTKNLRMDFSQEYIPHGYIEMTFPPVDGNKHSMDKNCLHIWPRNEYMLTALPNLDGSFSGTLFMPFKMFESIHSKKDLLELFEKEFPDALEIIGKLHLCDLFQKSKLSKMVTIRCNPYNLGEKCVIMGDAAHAMVPFYGQGMNSGFEDVTIFHEILQKNDFNLGKTCNNFSEKRNNDAKAMCELASYNYLELRKNVTMLSFRMRKMLDNLMNSLFPSYWIPLYTMVCFSQIPYMKCVEEKQKQDKILSRIQSLSIGVMLGSIIIGINRILQIKK